MPKEKEIGKNIGSEAGNENMPQKKEKAGLFSIALFKPSDKHPNAPRVSLSRFNTLSNRYERIRFFDGELEHFVALAKLVEANWFE